MIGLIAYVNLIGSKPKMHLIRLIGGVLCTVLMMVACQGQSSLDSSGSGEWEMDPSTPSQDSLDSWCTTELGHLTRLSVSGEASTDCAVYHLNGEPFTGWACEVLAENSHKFRYERFESGRRIWRIGYYDNGQIDADFRMRDCQNYGPSRMWLSDGGMYIDEFYSKPGIKHGIHRRWHGNGVLAREVKYQNGLLVYEKQFDQEGNLLDKTGNRWK